jgi:CheY-like chemotaxis protein
MRTKRILVVDDDPDLLFLVAHSVKSMSLGYVVDTASGAEAAIDKFGRQAFDLVVTDYMMPGKNGLELVKDLRQKSPDTKFLVMTAHQETAQVRNSVAEMELGFIGKPFVLPELAEAIEEALVETYPQVGEIIAETELPREAITESLTTLWHQTGALSVILADAQGFPLVVVGENNQAKSTRLSALVTNNFLAAAEMASLYGEGDFGIKSGFYEGQKINIYALNIRQRYFLVVIFKAGVKPGSVWFYTKQMAALLAKLIPVDVAASAHPANLDMSKDFDTIVGDKAGSDPNK